MKVNRFILFVVGCLGVAPGLFITATHAQSHLPAAAKHETIWGINGHPMTQLAYIDVSLEAQLDTVAELGARWYRCDISASDFFGNTARFDELVRLASARSIKILPVLIVSPELTAEVPTNEALEAKAAEFARAIVGRYHQVISTWELANELDGYAMIRLGETTPAGRQWIWDGAPDGSGTDDYDGARLDRCRSALRGLYDGCKAADSAAQTILDTAGWLHHGFITALSEARPPVSFDILAWHWYSEMGDMTRVQGQLDLVSRLKAYGKPLWITEINRRNGSRGEGGDAEMATYLANDLARLADHPAIEAIFLYELLDQPYFGPAGESEYGLVHLEKSSDDRWRLGVKKAAFTALQSLITLQRQAKD